MIQFNPLSRFRALRDNADDSGSGSNAEPADATETQQRAAPALPEDAVPVVPVRNMALFPQLVMPVALGRQRSIQAAQQAARSERQLALIQQRDPEVTEPAPEQLFEVGTAATILRYMTAPDGTHHAVCGGQRRIRVIEWLPDQPFLAARVATVAEPEAPTGDQDLEARMVRLRQKAVEALELLPQTPQELVQAIQNTEEAGHLADLVAAYMDLKTQERQAVLETLDLQERMDKVLELLEYRVQVLKLSQEINQQTEESINQRQREHMLREQLRTIQKELGEDEGKDAEIQELQKQLDDAELPEEADEAARKELKRLQRMPEASSEYSMSRTYLDWLLQLPWHSLAEQHIEIATAREILAADHYGLEKVKRRILEYLAVRKLNPEGKSPILCFVGPPGVGKTSLGQSIARAMGTRFHRLSLGGIHDESEIRGHRRTYIGAMPGNIVQGLHKVGQRNPVLMLDEVDKLGHGVHGDPAAALLEVLDPEQNSTFRDTYLGVAFDLSKVTFIATANVPDTIPAPLRDRMEIIELPGYTEPEKLEIARRYLLDRQQRDNGLAEVAVTVDDAALTRLIRDYTREAGCRNLERKIGAVMRNLAMRVAEGEAGPFHVTAEDLPDMLGPRRYEPEIALRTSVPGVATGLAWTPTGGDILFVEATRLPGHGKLTLTGQLGDVMKESAQAALTLVKNRSTQLGLAPASFDQHDIHVHVPAGATPKDGPSAGVAIFTALTSQLLGQRVRNDVAMTGEISLRGLVLPVGGIKEKVVAAAAAGITTVLLPARNKTDWEDIPEAARQQLEFVWLDTVDDALAVALPEEIDDAEAASPEGEPAPAESV